MYRIISEGRKKRIQKGCGEVFMEEERGGMVQRV